MKINKMLLLFLAGAFCSVFAHDFWVNGVNENDKFKAHIGYGHDFPNPEPIAQKRVKLFEPLALVSKNGKFVLTQSGENYEFQGAKLNGEAAILIGQYKPTFWSKDKNDKWSMDTNRQNGKDVTFCGLYEMTAKSFINGTGREIFTNPAGLSLEIVPLGDITEILANKPFKFRVVSNAKAVRDVEVKGTYAGLGDGKYAFIAKTDENGVIEFLPQTSAIWMLKVKLNKTYKDPKICDDDEIISTLTFEVK